MGNIIEVTKLTIEFQSRGAGIHRALDDFDMKLERGGTLSIVGESGSGKSTLLRAILALVAPTSGYVLLFGRDMSRVSPDELNSLRRRCGYVPQDPYGALPPGLSAIDAVMEPEIIAGIKRPREERRAKAEALLSEFGLRGERILSSRAVSLSGGQRQRVELARALMLEPELLLCDEPTSMQDASTRGDIVEALDRRAERGMSMLFVTHDIMLASRAAQRILVLKDGRLCEEGKSSEILSSPRHPYTKALLDALPRLK